MWRIYLIQSVEGDEFEKILCSVYDSEALGILERMLKQLGMRYKIDL